MYLLCDSLFVFFIIHIATNVRQNLEALRIEWRNSTPHLTSTPEEMKTLNITFNRVRIEPATCRVYGHIFCLHCTSGLPVSLFAKNFRFEDRNEFNGQNE